MLYIEIYKTNLPLEKNENTFLIQNPYNIEVAEEAIQNTERVDIESGEIISFEASIEKDPSLISRIISLANTPISIKLVM